jgi:hypothetical protein
MVSEFQRQWMISDTARFLMDYNDLDKGTAGDVAKRMVDDAIEKAERTGTEPTIKVYRDWCPCGCGRPSFDCPLGRRESLNRWEYEYGRRDRDRDREILRRMDGLKPKPLRRPAAAKVQPPPQPGRFANLEWS